MAECCATEGDGLVPRDVELKDVVLSVFQSMNTTAEGLGGAIIWDAVSIRKLVRDIPH